MHHIVTCQHEHVQHQEWQCVEPGVLEKCQQELVDNGDNIQGQ